MLIVERPEQIKEAPAGNAGDLDIFVETVHKDGQLRVKPHRKGQPSLRQQLRVP